MRIDMKNGWTIDSDNLQFCLFRPKPTVDKNGNETEYRYSQKFHSSLSSVLKTYADQRLKDSDAEGWDEVAKELKSIKKELARIRKALTVE